MVELPIRTNTSKAIEITAALFFFALGGCIYIAFRSTSLRMFGWFDDFGLHEIIIEFRKSTSVIRLPKTIKYCIPDGLWTLSYILFMDAIWDPNLKKQLIFGSIIPIVGGISEILQYFNVINGTFDVVDLLCYIIPYVVFLILKIKL